MKLGIFIADLAEESGGIYQATSFTVDMLHNISLENSDNEYFLLLNENMGDIEKQYPNFKSIILPTAKPTLKSKILKKLRDSYGQTKPFCFWRYLRKKIFPYNEAWLNQAPIHNLWTNICKNEKIECILYLNNPSLPRIDLPYILFVPDLQHRFQNFPELSEYFEYNARERLFRTSCRDATTIYVDSDTGKEDLLFCYSHFGVKAEDVFILKYLPTNKLDADINIEESKKHLNKYNLPEKFFFYPAQFWAHKNHRKILEALTFISDRWNVKYHIVFTGFNTNHFRDKNYKEIRDFCDYHNLNEQCHFLGYVDSYTLVSLYKNAVAMVMPTFCGPANIPVIEAWQMECPVIYSDIRGLKQQAKDAALLVDPHYAVDIADAMYKLYNNEDLRQQLIAKGKAKFSSYTADDYKKSLQQIIDHTKRKLNK